jgi:hypothetical protein
MSTADTTTPDNETIDLTEHEFVPPCDATWHQEDNTPALPAAWILWLTPIKPCGCKSPATIVLWCDPCWQKRIRLDQVQCRVCRDCYHPLENVVKVERLRR